MKSRKLKWAMIICTFSFALVLFLFSPFFNANDIVITGNNIVSEAEIRERMDISSTTNLLFYNQTAARCHLMENHYIAEVTFTRSLPGRLYIHVWERRLAAYIEQSPGTFLYIDDQGRVLEVRSTTSQALPIIEGLSFTRFALGEILDVPDSAAFNIVTQYSQLLYRHGLASRVTHINVSDTANTRILFGYVEFNVGGLRDSETKVRIIAGILDEMPEPELARGFVDLRDIHSERGEFFFVILT